MKVGTLPLEGSNLTLFLKAIKISSTGIRNYFMNQLHLLPLLHLLRLLYIGLHAVSNRLDLLFFIWTTSSSIRSDGMMPSKIQQYIKSMLLCSLRIHLSAEDAPKALYDQIFNA